MTCFKLIDSDKIRGTYVNHNNCTRNKEKNKGTEGDRSYSERVRVKWFCCVFKLGFLQLICKASLIFKSNLELALSIILKQRDRKTKNKERKTERKTNKPFHRFFDVFILQTLQHFKPITNQSIQNFS